MKYLFGSNIYIVNECGKKYQKKINKNILYDLGKIKNADLIGLMYSKSLIKNELIIIL